MRVVRSLGDHQMSGFTALDVGSIVIAEEITPADTALMDPRRIGGFATVLGGAEGHTAIMARSLGLPAVLGVTGLFGGVQSGDTVVIDGSNGRVIVNPTARCLAGYKRPKEVHFIAFDDFPRSTSGKIQRHALEARLTGDDGTGG